MKKRLLATLLAFCLTLTLWPAAMADEDTPPVSDVPMEAAAGEDAGRNAPAAAEELPVAALAGTVLGPSEEIADFIKAYESFSAHPYNDGTGWYIGYGVACDPADWPDGITEEEATQLLWEKLDGFAASVHSFLNKYSVSVTQGQFDALVSMTYNFGPSWLNVSNRLPLYLSRGIKNYSEWEIVNAFGAWCHVNGKVNEPLLRRRIAEAMVFLHDDYSRDVSAWCRLDIDAAGGSMDTDVWCYRVGQSYGTLPLAQRSGCTFAGWRRDDGTFLAGSDIASGTVHVTAVWNVFPDVTPNDWFYEVVMELTGKKVIAGFEDGTFRPKDPVTRGQALRLVLSAAGYSAQSAASGQHWAAGYRSFAAGRGFIRERDYADLDEVIIRDEIADLAAAVLKLNTSAYTERPFADSDRPSVLALYGEGIVVGSFNESGQRLFKGSDNIIRAEMAVIVQKISGYVEKNPLPGGPNPTPAPADPTPPPAADPRLNNYDRAKFRTKFRTVENEDGEEVKEIDRIYYDDPAYDVRYGIDVSYYQKNINWQAVAADGIDFAILRAGYRGSSKGSLNEDSRFGEYARGAAAAGLDIGVYYFSQAITPEEAAQEAEETLRLIRKYNVKVTFPIAFDWEPQEVNNSRTRMEVYDYSVLTECARAFCRTIERAGYTPVVYTNPSIFNRGYNTGLLKDYDLWLAHYTERTNFPYNFTIWQYGSSGNVKGIEGRVDMDIAFVNYAKK